MSSKKSSGKRTVKKRKLRKRPGVLCWLAAAAVMAAMVFCLYELLKLNVLPVLMVIAVCLIAFLITFFLLRFWLLRSRRPVSRLIAGTLSVILGVGFLVGGRYLNDTDRMLENVTDLTDKVANTVTVYAMVDDYEDLGELKGKTLGVMSSSEPQGTSGLLEQIQKKGVNTNNIEFDNVYALVDALYSHSVDAIALPEQFHDALNEAANDENKYNALTTFTNVLDQYIYYTERDQVTLNPSDPVRNVTRDPFVVLISGNDSYGTLNSISRSDVNMLVAVNPKTAQILMVSMPRDTYMPITCKKNQSACASVSGQSDKMTHSGLYGVGATESSVEDFLDIPINYTVRLNFSSLINIVDAIGGVDVEVDPGLEVDTFYANGTEGVHAGTNHLDGERALAFSRERHAYVDGDNQRVRNQQIVMKALIRAMISPSMAANYPKVMQALSTAFETNMSAKEIKSLIAFELSRFPAWNIQSVAMVNEQSTEFSPALGDYAAVTLADTGQVQEVKALIQNVLNGGKVEPVDLNAYSSGQYAVETQNGPVNTITDDEIYQSMQSGQYNSYQQDYSYSYGTDASSAWQSETTWDGGYAQDQSTYDYSVTTEPDPSAGSHDENQVIHPDITYEPLDPQSAEQAQQTN